MALLESYLCCSLLVASATVGVYALVAYIVAFTIELWWILEAEVTLPAPAYLLCGAYFILFISSAFLLHGITVKRTMFLLSWLFTSVVLSFPEAGLVFFMTFHHWNVKSLYGLTELIFWSCRMICNIAGMVCVQSLYSTWKEEKHVMRRLQDLNMASIVSQSTLNRSASPNNGHLKNGNPMGYQNAGYMTSSTRLNMLAVANVPPPGRLRRSASTASHLNLQSAPVFGGSLPNNNFAIQMPPITPLNNLQYAFLGAADSAATGSEFNASNFDGFFAASVGSTICDTKKMFLPDSNVHRNILGVSINRTQSLMDLRETPKTDNLWFSRMPLPALSVDYLQCNPNNVTQSLDRRVLRRSGKLRRASSLDELNYYADSQGAYIPPNNALVGNIPRTFFYSPYDFYLHGNPRTFVKTGSSKRSLAESDDMQKIRDVAL